MASKKEKIVPLASHLKNIFSTQDDIVNAVIVLRKVLRGMRWHDQGGYVGLDDGKWSFISTSIPGVEPEDLNVLFKLAGIEPDEIVPKGDCVDCKFAEDGRERGYKQPCVVCSRPYHSHFVPLNKIKKKAGNG